MQTHQHQADSTELGSDASAVDVSGLLPSSVIQGTDICTPWGHAAQSDPALARQHQLFQELVLSTIDNTAPWLRAVIQATGARLVAWQGCCVMGIPTHTGTAWIPLSTVSEWLNLLPWQEDGQAPQ